MKKYEYIKEDLPQTSIPRELCLKCYDWCSQEDVGWNDIPHCLHDDYRCIDYLRGLTNDCPKFCEL